MMGRKGITSPHLAITGTFIYIPGFQVSKSKNKLFSYIDHDCFEMLCGGQYVYHLLQ